MFKKLVVMLEELAGLVSEYLPAICFALVIVFGYWFYFFGPHGVKEISLYVPDEYNLTSEIAGNLHIVEFRNSEEEERPIQRLPRVEDFESRVEEGDIVEIILLRRVPGRLDVVYSLRKDNNTFLVEKSYDNEEMKSADWAENNLKARIKPSPLFSPYDERYYFLPATFLFAVVFGLVLSFVRAALGLIFRLLKYLFGF